MGGFVSACKKVVRTVTRVVKKVFRVVKKAVRKVFNGVRRFYKKYVKPVIQSIHNFAKRCVKTIKRVVNTVKRKIKKVVKTIVKKVKYVYRKYIKPWVKPIIDKVKKFIPVVNVISRGINFVKNSYNFFKNSFKAIKNYVSGGNYKKYWNKIKTYGKKAFNDAINVLGKSTIIGNVIHFGKAIYDTGKKIYLRCNRTYNFIKNGYNYINNYSKGINNKSLIKRINKLWKSKNNFIQKIPFVSDKFKNPFDFINNIHKKGKDYISYYNKMKENLYNYKDKINIYKNNISSQISELNSYKNKYLNITNRLKDIDNNYKQLLKNLNEKSNYSCEIIVMKWKTMPHPRPLIYCSNCKVYCCPVCNWPENIPLCPCSYFYNGGTCPKCPGQCSIHYHVRKCYTDPIKYYETERIIDEHKKKEYDEICKEVRFIEKEKIELNNTISNLKNEYNNIQNNINSLKNTLNNISIKSKGFFSFNGLDKILMDVESQKNNILDKLNTIGFNEYLV